LVYCGQTNGWMELGTQVGLSPGHIVLDGDRAPPPQRGTAPQFSAHICCGQMAGWINMPLGIDVGLGPRDFVLDWHRAVPSPKRGRSAYPNCRPMSIVAKQLHESRCDLVRRYSLGQSTLLHGEAAPSQKRHTPNFRPMSIVAERLHISGYHLVRR